MEDVRIKKKLALNLEQELALVFDPTQYPRVYSLSAARRWCFVIFGAAMMNVGMVGVWPFGLTSTHGQTTNWGVSLGVFAFGLMVLIRAYFGRVTLTRDSIEYRNLLEVRTLMRDDIAGYRLKPAQFLSSLEITPKRAELKKLIIAKGFAFDAQFDAWFSGIDNYDQIAGQAALHDICNDAVLGRTPEERLAKLAQAKKIANGIVLITIIATFLGIFSPLPNAPLMAILIILPWLAIGLCLRRGGGFSVGALDSNSARADLTSPLLFPGYGLLARLPNDIYVLDARHLLQASVMFWLMMVLLLIIVVPALLRSWGKSALLAIFLVVYCAALMVLCNTWLDHTAPHSDTVKVLNKRATQGRSATWYFTVSPWTGVSMPTEIRVSQEVYQVYAVGDNACMNVYNGALGAPWYRFGLRGAC